VVPSLPVLALLIRPLHAEWLPERRARSPYQDGVTALDLGELDRAEVLLRQALSRDPTCGAAGHALALALLRQERPDEAQTLLDQVRVAHPERVEPLIALSNVAFVTQDFAGARTTAERATELAPESLDAWGVLLQALLRQGELSAADAALDVSAAFLEAADLACLRVQVALEAGDSEGAEVLHAECEAGGASDLVARVRAQRSLDAGEASAVRMDDLGLAVEARLITAAELLNDGDAAAALEILDDVLTTHAVRVDARVLRAHARHSLGDAAGALADLEAARAGGTWVDIHRSGQLSGILRRSDERRLDDLLVQGAALMVDLLRALGEVDAAQARWQEARQAFGPGPELSGAHAKLLGASGAGTDAWQVVAEGLRTWPDDLHLLDAAGFLALSVPDGLTASEAEALARSPRWTDRVNLAIALWRRDEPKPCLAIARRALSVTPEAERQRVSALAHRCATATGDLVAADALLGEAGGPDALDVVVAVNHALMRYGAGDDAGAMALISAHLDDLPSGGAGAMVLALGARLHTRGERWRDAAEIAHHPRTPAGEALAVLDALVAAGQLGTARALAPAVCRRLDGDAAVRCRQLSVRLGP